MLPTMEKHLFSIFSSQGFSPLPGKLPSQAPFPKKTDESIYTFSRISSRPNEGE